MKIDREYAHRTHGAIGAVSLEVPEGKFKLNGKELAAGAVEHLMRFSLQTFQDAYAGCDNQEDCVTAFEAKIKRVIDGTIGVRTGGGGEPAINRFIRAIVRNNLSEKNKTAYGEVDSTDQAARKAFLDSVYEGADEKVQKQIADLAKTELDAYEQRKKDEKDLAATLKL